MVERETEESFTRRGNNPIRNIGLENPLDGFSKDGKTSLSYQQQLQSDFYFSTKTAGKLSGPQ